VEHAVAPVDRLLQGLAVEDIAQAGARRRPEVEAADAVTGARQDALHGSAPTRPWDPVIRIVAILSCAMLLARLRPARGWMLRHQESHTFAYLAHASDPSVRDYWQKWPSTLVYLGRAVK
jgi:hypothetical protein